MPDSWRVLGINITIANTLERIKVSNRSRRLGHRHCSAQEEIGGALDTGGGGGPGSSEGKEVGTKRKEMQATETLLATKTRENRNEAHTQRGTKDECEGVERERGGGGGGGGEEVVVEEVEEVGKMLLLD